MHPGGLDDGLVGGRVAAGVMDHRQPCGGAGQGAEPTEQLVDHAGELGYVGPVALVGVMQDRHAAIAGHHQAHPDQAQVEPLLLGVASLGELGAGVGGVDEGGEVGHVQHQPRQIQPERLPKGHASASHRQSEPQPGNSG